jgi:hypothetical protein
LGSVENSFDIRALIVAKRFRQSAGIRFRSANHSLNENEIQQIQIEFTIQTTKSQSKKKKKKWSQRWN